jgi:hypothetical protein
MVDYGQHPRIDQRLVGMGDRVLIALGEQGRDRVVHQGPDVRTPATRAPVLHQQLCKPAGMQNVVFSGLSTVFEVFDAQSQLRIARTRTVFDDRDQTRDADASIDFVVAQQRQTPANVGKLGGG